MKSWWMLLCAFLVILGGFGYVYAEKSSGVHTIQISDHSITPATITVQLNDVVKLQVTNNGTKKHNLVIPDYFIFTQNLNTGETTDAEFTANKKGTFPYFSDTPGQPETGIRGTLVVQ